MISLLSGNLSTSNILKTLLTNIFQSFHVLNNIQKCDWEKVMASSLGLIIGKIKFAIHLGIIVDY